MARASLVQDLWLGFEPRLRARRLAPWQEPATRLLFQLDPGQRLDDPAVASLLEAFGARLEVVAWEPRGGAAGVPGPELLDDARRIASEGGRRFGPRRVLLGGHGLGAWVALASAGAPGLSGALALAPALAGAGPSAPHPSALRTALASGLTLEPPDLPVLVAEGRDRPASEARVAADWLAGAWPSAITAWADSLERASP